jgi:hypothetical protein
MGGNIENGSSLMSRLPLLLRGGHHRRRQWALQDKLSEKL